MGTDYYRIIYLHVSYNLKGLYDLYDLPIKTLFFILFNYAILFIFIFVVGYNIRVLFPKSGFYFFVFNFWILYNV